jgi:cardiolipin synthase (CMP-forming)
MGLANWLTIVRIILVPVFVTLVVYGRVRVALCVFVLAGMTDLMDGYIARTRGTKTRLGAFLDPLADKLLLTASFVTLTYKFPRVLPFWLTAMVLSRDLVLILVAVLAMLTGGQVRPAPTMLGKTSTAFQMLTVGTALLAVAWTGLWAPFRPGMIWITAGLTVASAVQYLVLAPRFVVWESR